MCATAQRLKIVVALVSLATALATAQISTHRPATTPTANATITATANATATAQTIANATTATTTTPTTTTANIPTTTAPTTTTANIPTTTAPTTTPTTATTNTTATATTTALTTTPTTATTNTTATATTTAPTTTTTTATTNATATATTNAAATATATAPKTTTATTLTTTSTTTTFTTATTNATATTTATTPTTSPTTTMLVSPVASVSVTSANETCVTAAWPPSDTPDVKYILTCNEGREVDAGSSLSATCCGLASGEEINLAVVVWQPKFNDSSIATTNTARTQLSRPVISSIKFTASSSNISAQIPKTIKIYSVCIQANCHNISASNSVCEFSNLQPSTLYNLTVRIVKDGFPASNQVFKAVLTDPSGPTRYILTRDSHKIALSFTVSSASNRITASLSPGSEKHCNVTGRMCTITFHDLTPETQYELKYWAEYRGQKSPTEHYQVRTKPEPKVSLSLLVVAVTGTILFLATAVVATAAAIFVRRNLQRDDAEGVLCDIPLHGRSSHRVAIADFGSYAAFMLRDSELEVHRQFNEMRIACDTLEHTKFTFEAAMEDCNRAKNRYTDILPYDHTRVTLEPNYEGLLAPDDYINANYIRGLDREREFIACQGPLPGTLDDHWRMIYQHKVTLIITLTQCLEGEKKKCERFWPSVVGQSEHYDEIKVVLKSENSVGTYSVRKMLVTCSADRNQSEPLQVVQLFYLGWADFSVPNVDDLTDFLANMRSYAPMAKRGDSEPPILVHCSAGVGRTGTLIALDILVRSLELRKAKSINVYETVMELRACRKLMVQTKGQLAFIYRFLVSYLEKRGYIQPLPAAMETSSGDQIDGDVGASNSGFQLPDTA